MNHETNRNPRIVGLPLWMLLLSAGLSAPCGLPLLPAPMRGVPHLSVRIVWNRL